MDYLLQVRKNVLEAIQLTPAVQGVLSGEPNPVVYGRYLTNVWHYAQHSSIVIGHAAARCVPDNPKLADYLFHHAREELGHDVWALQDMEALGMNIDDVRKSRPVPSCAAMVGFEYFTASHANPVGLFGWLYVLEAMGDDLGQVVSERIAQGLKLPDGVKFLKGHGEADVAHTKDLTEQIQTNIDSQDIDDVYHVADVMADLYVRIFREIGEEPTGVLA